MVFLDFLNDGDTPEKPVHRLVAMIPLAMVLFAVAYNFYSLYPEVGIQVLARTTVCCTWLPLIGRHRLYMVVTTGYFGLVGSELSFRGEKKGLYPAASAWLTSGLPGEATPIIKFQRESGEAEPAFLLSNAEYLMAQAQTPAGPSRGDVYAEASGSNIYLAEVSVERESVLMFAEAKTVMLMPSYI